MKTRNTNDTSPADEKVLEGPADAAPAKTTRSRWWSWANFLAMALLVTVIWVSESRRSRASQTFHGAFNSVALNQAYREDLFYPKPVELAVSGESFDKMIVYYNQGKIAILGLKQNKIACSYMAAYPLSGGAFQKVDDTVIADGNSQPLDPVKVGELTQTSRDRLVELFRNVFEHDAAIKAKLGASSRKDYAVMRGEMYVFIVTHMKRDIGIQIRSQE
ncbi:MAG: hypothetical protein ABFD69_01110 [Candidatus Sumerlaeia bacterium]